MTKAMLMEFVKSYSPGIMEGIEESTINGYTVKYFIEGGTTVGGMVVMADEEVCMITAEGFIVGELPDSNEFMC